jgi:IS30 family transposase
MAYQRVTEAERTLIYRWNQEGLGNREISRRLNRAPISIGREFARNTGLRGYRPKQAHAKAVARSKRLGPRRFTDEVRIDAETRIGRCPRQEGRGRGRIPNQRSIDTRPAAVETRLSVGNWEGDLINGRQTKQATWSRWLNATRASC